MSQTARRYRDMLKGRAVASASASASLEGLEGLESMSADDSELDLSEPAIQERVNSTEDTLKYIIKEYLDDKPELHEIAKQIVTDGGEALRILGNEEDLPGDVIDGLEAIVRTDGSRPSFMVRNGDVDLNTSPVGIWKDSITMSRDLLRGALECVGRVDVPGSLPGFQGTGWLIHENLIITNRHVLQVTADWQQDGSWKIKPEAAIDFGHEFRARESVNRRALRRVVFAGPEPIPNTHIDHKKLDLAVMELEPASADNRPSMVLSITGVADWAQPDAQVYIIGYPGSPRAGQAPPSLLEQLFKSTYGHKRLAPGYLMPSQQNVHTWTIAHDGTTLGGNSGSVVLVIGREHAAAGLHYGGRWGEPRENWAHVLGLVMETVGVKSDKTLRETLAEFGVTPVDPFNV